MRKGLLIIFTGLILFDGVLALDQARGETEGHKPYCWRDNSRVQNIDYWAKVQLSINDFDYKSGDTEFLGLGTKKKGFSVGLEVDPDIYKEFFSYVKQALIQEKPFHDGTEGYDARFAKFHKTNKKNDPNFHKKWRSQESIRAKKLFGKYPGQVYCNVRVKGREFPIMYHTACSLSAEEPMRYDRLLEVKNLDNSDRESLEKKLVNDLKSYVDKLVKIREQINECKKLR